MVVDNDQSLQSIRVMLDAKLPRSAMIVVTSASEHDGQADVACGLARAFNESGRRTAVISLYDNGDIGSEASGASFFQAPLAATEIAALVPEVRSGHAAVIVASPPIIARAAALDLCRTAEGVLLAVRLGRKITEDDEDTVRQLQSVSARILGVVATRPPARRAEKSLDVAFVPEPALDTAPMRVSSLLAAALIFGGSGGASGQLPFSVPHNTSAQITAVHRGTPRTVTMPKSIARLLASVDRQTFTATASALDAIDDASYRAHSALSHAVAAVTSGN